MYAKHEAKLKARHKADLKKTSTPCNHQQSSQSKLERCTREENCKSKVAKKDNTYLE
jgi:hypothetical protein